MDIRPVNYDEYVGTFREDMIQEFTDGKLTDIEDVRKFLYGFATSPIYLDQFMYMDETLPRWWDENAEERHPNVGHDSKEIPYVVDTLQEKLIIDAMLSTGDGFTQETAIYIIDVAQEYDFIARVYPDLSDCIKCQTLVSDESEHHEYDYFEFEDNIYEIKELWFECSRSLLRSSNQFKARHQNEK